MLTEEKLPLLVQSIDYNSGMAEVIVRTEIKRDGEVIHTIRDHQKIPIADISDAIEPLSAALDSALQKKSAQEVIDTQQARASQPA